MAGATLEQLEQMEQDAFAAFEPGLNQLSSKGRTMGFRNLDEVWKHIDRIRAEIRRLQDETAAGGSGGSCPLVAFSGEGA
jgi:hypothetical protein